MKLYQMKCDMFLCEGTVKFCDIYVDIYVFTPLYVDMPSRRSPSHTGCPSLTKRHTCLCTTWPFLWLPPPNFYLFCSRIYSDENSIVVHVTSTSQEIQVKQSGKNLRVPGGWRSQIFKTIGTKLVRSSALVSGRLYPPPPPPGNIPRTHFYCRSQ